MKTTAVTRSAISTLAIGLAVAVGTLGQATSSLDNAIAGLTVCYRCGVSSYWADVFVCWLLRPVLTGSVALGWVSLLGFMAYFVRRRRTLLDDPDAAAFSGPVAQRMGHSGIDHSGLAQRARSRAGTDSWIAASQLLLLWGSLVVTVGMVLAMTNCQTCSVRDVAPHLYHNCIVVGSTAFAAMVPIWLGYDLKGRLDPAIWRARFALMDRDGQ